MTEFEEQNRNLDQVKLKKRIDYNFVLIDIEIKMRVVDMITQRDILLKEFKDRNETRDNLESKFKNKTMLIQEEFTLE